MDGTTIRFPAQPSPIDWQVSILIFPGGRVASGVTRVWAAGDTRRCRLCPNCVAFHDRGFCVVLVNQVVAFEDAPSFSTAGFAEVGPLSPGDGHTLTLGGVGG